MEVYRYSLQFEDYVFYATTERGKVFETGWFIHNYALTYALGLALSNYREEQQKPDYQGQLAPLNQAGIYITPAMVLDVTRYCINQFNTIGETLVLKREKSPGYPAWGFAKMFRPLGQRFARDRSGNILQDRNSSPIPQKNATGYLICRESLDKSIEHLRQHYESNGINSDGINVFPTQYLRLGKFMAKVKMTLTPAKSVSCVNQARSLTGLLNWADLPTQPQLFDLIASALPTRLIASARFLTGSNLIKVEFEDNPTEVYLPADMSYLVGRGVRR